MSTRVVCLGVVAAVLAALFLLSGLQGAMRRALSITTADPDVLGLVASSSMEPVAITLHTRRPARAEDGEKVAPTHAPPRLIERKITFKAPATYFNVLDLNEGPTGPQRVGFSVWSGTFEPLQPDLIREQEIQRALQKSGADKASMPVGEKSAIRRRMRKTGEYELKFEVSNVFRADASVRQRGLKYLVERYPERPCSRELLADIGLERLSIPDSVRPRESCLAAPQVQRNRVHYRKTNPDGSIDFVVVCHGGGVNRSGQPVLAARCQMHGYFRSWPLFVRVDSRHPEHFISTFQRINSFLASIAEGPSDL